MGMGRYDIAPYMRGGEKRVRVRVRRWTCECCMETGDTGRGGRGEAKPLQKGGGLDGQPCYPLCGAKGLAKLPIDLRPYIYVIIASCETSRASPATPTAA